MDNSFDPYHQWLGIPKEDQPPNHYRLLGLDMFEENEQVIARVGERQIMHVDKFTSGEHHAVAQQILSQLSIARQVLLDPERRSAYNDELRQGTASRSSSPPPVSSVPPVTSVPPVNSVPPVATVPIVADAPAEEAELPVAKQLPEEGSTSSTEPPEFVAPAAVAQDAKETPAVFVPAPVDGLKEPTTSAASPRRSSKGMWIAAGGTLAGLALLAGIGFFSVGRRFY